MASKLSNYLREIGILTDSPEAIAAEKRKYWNRLKAGYRKVQRQKNKIISVTFSLSEYSTVTKQAKRHRRSRCRFIHDSSLAYCANTTIQLDPQTANDLNQTLLLIYHALRDLADEKTLSGEMETNIMQHFEVVQRTITTALEQPKHMEHAIRELIESDPVYKQTIIDLINVL